MHHTSVPLSLRACFRKILGVTFLVFSVTNAFAQRDPGPRSGLNGSVAHLPPAIRFATYGASVAVILPP